MILGELENFCKKAREAGIEGNTPICVLGDSGDKNAPEEMVKFEVYSGEYNHNPSPKLQAPQSRNGQFIFLRSGSENKWVKEQEKKDLNLNIHMTMNQAYKAVASGLLLCAAIFYITVYLIIPYLERDKTSNEIKVDEIEVGQIDTDLKLIKVNAKIAYLENINKEGGHIQLEDRMVLSDGVATIDDIGEEYCKRAHIIDAKCESGNLVIVLDNNK